MEVRNRIVYFEAIGFETICRCWREFGRVDGFGRVGFKDVGEGSKVLMTLEESTEI